MDSPKTGWFCWRAWIEQASRKTTVNACDRTRVRRNLIYDCARCKFHLASCYSAETVQWTRLFQRESCLRQCLDSFRCEQVPLSANGNEFQSGAAGNSGRRLSFMVPYRGENLVNRPT